VINDERMHDFFSQWNNYTEELSDKIGKNISDKNKNVFIPRNINLDYETMQNNLHIVFGENANVEQEVCLFDDVLEFLQCTVQVEGADRLFSKHFYDIEWNMFLEADFDKSEMKIYRDHFVHQIRDAYLGYYLIWELGLYKNIVQAIKNYDSTGLSQFIDVYKSKEQSSKEQDCFYQQVVWKTWFLSALFHDIGYPLAYHQRNSIKMDKYMPYLRVLDNKRQMDFVELSALLCNTYLFKIVDYNELKSKYEDFDHGMLSAICLLLNYYHTGSIHGLSNADRCSIELAAYVIFVHTRKYCIQEDDKENKSKFVRPIFIEDPISYILRLSDDLQEWARVYFLVGENSNTLICKKCSRLVKKVKEDDDGDKYICECGNQFVKITAFKYRKINLVEVCNNLEINDDGRIITFKLDYDLVKLLEILNIDKRYAKYRRKELLNLKKILPNQALLPEMKIEFFLSNNHMMLKTEILRRYIEKNISEVNYTKELTYDFMLKKKEEVRKKIIDALSSKATENLKKSLEDELESIIKYLQEDNDKQFIINDNPPSNYLENIYLYKLINELNYEY
jgi:hypothetical protein